MAYAKNVTNYSKKPQGYYANIRPEMMSYVPQSVKKVIEFGCGEGVFGAQIAKRNLAEVWGIEIDTSSGTKARKRLHKVLIGDANECLKDLPDNYFDCILFNDVLEHLTDPYSLLMKLRNKLVKNGVVVSSIPNMRYYPVLMDLFLRGKWDYEDAGILDKTHYRFFTKSSIQTMFQVAGYNIEKIEGINPISDLPLKFKVLNSLSRKRLEDTRYLQFACVAVNK